MKKVRILFVCLGNICRSPLGAAILKQKIKINHLDSWVEVDSCGTSNYHIGQHADPRTIANASRNGVPIVHSARQLIESDLENFDFIFAMDKSNYENILRLANGKDFQHKIKLMREFDGGNGLEVPDPYHGAEKDFQEVFEILDRATSNFIDYLKQKYPDTV
jgi:Protein-tyrosine-phosphatase